MRKMIMRLRSQLGATLEVVKQDGEYMLVAKEDDEDGVTQLKIFTDKLISLGWKDEKLV